MNRSLIVVLLVAGAVWHLWPDSLHSAYSDDLAGLVAPIRVSGLSPFQAPQQRLLESTDSLRVDDLEIRLRAEFEVAARVLSREDYRWGEWAGLSPLDLALGWGPMSDPSVLADIDISQGGRFYSWRVDEFPIPRADIEQSSANMHIIVGQPYLFDRLDAVQAGDQLRLSGYLVDVDRDDGWYWRTSLIRTDTGNGACELFLVTDVESI
ncbi:MAG: hypothetical protein AAGJ52_04530 [Pseudomonadota bacterium]